MNTRHSNGYVVAPTGENHGHCDCCGTESRTVWGRVSADGSPVAAYFVQWTRGQPDHFPNLDFLIGSWGDDERNDRVLVSWAYSASRDQFMLIDSGARPAAGSALCANALTREQVLSDEALLELARNLLDATWEGDPRLDDMKTTPGP